ncbi:hypothetical protein psal_cds_652 [Pandoravirus salinus]|uniref:Uncharacterized protein n=1 Tax=Pandoravirus salinus TaxID=1349410 RepID=S4VYL9_9VIRU|nr:hypothetical protein psal_cds_652 [Pandoravirus salinus]AGO84556.1 hypothetical protein psal_cds_652 [Pandoravirus salinus]
MTTPTRIQDALKAVDRASKAAAAASEALSVLSLLLNEMAVSDEATTPVSTERAPAIGQMTANDVDPAYRARLSEMSDADLAILDGVQLSVFEPRIGERASLSEIRRSSLAQRVRALAHSAAAADNGSMAEPPPASTSCPIVMCVSSDNGKAITVGQLVAVLNAHPDAAVYVRVCADDSSTIAEEHPIAVAASTMRFEPSGDPARPARPYFHRKSHQWIGLVWDTPLSESITALCIGASAGSEAQVPTASKLAKTLAAYGVGRPDMPVEVGVWTAQGPRTGALVEVFLKTYDAGKRAITLMAKDGVFPWPADAVEAANSPETARTIDAAMAVAAAMASVPTFTDEHIAKCMAALVPESWTIPTARRTIDGIIPPHEKKSIQGGQDLVVAPTQARVLGTEEDDKATVQTSAGGPDAALAEQMGTDGVHAHHREPATLADTSSAFDTFIVDEAEFDPTLDRDSDMDMRLFNAIR